MAHNRVQFQKGLSEGNRDPTAAGQRAPTHIDGPRRRYCLANRRQPRQRQPRRGLHRENLGLQRTGVR